MTYIIKPPQVAFIGDIKQFWRRTDTGYCLHCMDRWWVAAKWLDDASMLPAYERSQVKGPLWSTWVIGYEGTLCEPLSDSAFAFRKHDQCQVFCYRMHPGLELMPLNLGDYIRYSRFRAGYREAPNMKRKSSVEYFNSRPDVKENS